MRSKRFSILVLCAACLLTGAFASGQAVTQVRANDQGFLIVPVSINGSGPYSFFLDTGSNRTLIRKELLESLSVVSGRPVPAHMATGVGYVHQAMVTSVAVAGLTVHDLAVEEIDAAALSKLGSSFEGVLGEDFLKHFDLLLDNHAKTLTLDATPELADSLAGDHLPLSFAGTREGHATADRLVLELQLPSSRETMHFLIDSGANHSIFFPARALPLQSRAGQSGGRPGGTLKTFSGSGHCQTDVVPLAIGKEKLPEVEMAFCEGMRGNTDVDGLLPTSSFKRLFISHAGAYAVVNPRLRKSSAALPSRSAAGN